MDFDTVAKDWDVNPKMIERANILANQLKEYFNFDNNTMTAFEFGSGTGLLSYHLRDSFKSITLADSSEGMVNVLKAKIANENIKNLHPVLIDMPKNNLSIDKVDYVFTFMALHHVIEIDKLLKNFNSMLNANGYICIGDLVTEDGSFHSHDSSFDGHNGFDKDELTTLLANNGFVVEHYKVFYEIEKEYENQMKKYPLFLIIAKKSS
ncbi:MAG: class I SAM-dependent methyltransferase [Bacteroidota bacterium]